MHLWVKGVLLILGKAKKSITVKNNSFDNLKTNPKVAILYAPAKIQTQIDKHILREGTLYINKEQHKK